MKKRAIAIVLGLAAVISAGPAEASTTFDATGAMAGTTVFQPTFLLNVGGTTQTCQDAGLLCFTKFDGTYKYTGTGTGLPSPMKYDGLMVVHPPFVNGCAPATMNLFLQRGASNILLEAGSGSQVCQTAPGQYSLALSMNAVSGMGKFAGVTGTFSITGTAVELAKAKVDKFGFVGTTSGSITF